MADILSQEEVDLLLSAVSEDDLDKSDVMEAPKEEKQPFSVYDFRRPDRISKEQFRGLQGLFEAFAMELSLLLPGYLRTVSRVDLVSIDQLTYDEFILSVGRPTSLNIIRMTPLEGLAVLEFSPNLVFPTIDRLLGGKGDTPTEPRELTEIEQKILQKIIVMVLDSLTRAWSSLVEFRLKIQAQENDPLIVQIVPGSEMVLLVGFEIHVGETSGAMNLCIPLIVLNPILDRIASQSQYAPTMSDVARRRTEAHVYQILTNVDVPVSVELGSTNICLGELLKIQEGDIVVLDTATSHPIDVLVNNRPKYLAKPGRVGKKSAVQILSVHRDAKPVGAGIPGRESVRAS